MLRSDGKRPRPRVFDDTPPLTNRERGDAHERDVARSVGGRTQPNSGASPWVSHKADVKTDTFLLQCKTTEGNRFTVTQASIAEIVKQAALQSREPSLVIRLEGISQELPNEWVLITMAAFKEYITDVSR